MPGPHRDHLIRTALTNLAEAQRDLLCALHCGSDEMAASAAATARHHIDRAFSDVEHIIELPSSQATTRGDS